MNDPKAAAAYHPGDARVVRPDLDAIQARVAAATSGPWYVDEIPETGECRVLFDADPEGQPTYMPVTSGGSHRGDADLIAHARQDVPALLAALAAERARADQAEQRIANAKMLIRTWNINGATLSNLFEVLSADSTTEQ